MEPRLSPYKLAPGAYQALSQMEAYVKQIAAELGYDDEAYFSRMFKKAVGVSPRDYQAGRG